jgi:hypothetical protein
MVVGLNPDVTDHAGSFSHGNVPLLAVRSPAEI